MPRGEHLPRDVGKFNSDKKHQSNAGYGRARQIKALARLYPKRNHMQLHQAIEKLGFRYWREVEVYDGVSNRYWIDAVVSTPKGLLGIDIRERIHVKKTTEARTIKGRILLSRGMNYLVIDRVGSTMTTQAYISRYVRRMKMRKVRAANVKDKDTLWDAGKYIGQSEMCIPVDVRHDANFESGSEIATILKEAEKLGYEYVILGGY